MAQVDNSIYFKQRTPNLLGGFESGFRLGDLVRQRNTDDEIKEAYKAGIKQNEDGTTSYDRNVTLGKLAGIDGRKYLEAKNQFDMQDQNQQRLQKEKQLNQLDMISRISGSVQDQTTYDQALNLAKQQGLDVSMFGPRYDETTKRQLNFYRGMALTEKDRLAEELKKQDFSLRERELQDKALDRKEARAMRFANQQATNTEKQLVRDEKKKSMLNEVEDRRTNIEDNITLLENMIKDKGTYELFGSHNADMGRLVDQIATDMAKLTDPSSVARPSEVEMFKKGLVEPNMATTSNTTALDILKNFRGEVNKRADNAYKIRGLENPGSQAEKTIASPQVKVINGQTYRKVEGGWLPASK